jgi:hypothetical protein
MSGPVGKAVTVVGTNFTGVSSVLFGSTPASFTVASKTKIVADAPAHGLGTVDVKVANPGGTSPIVPGDQYTYLTPH